MIELTADLTEYSGLLSILFMINADSIEGWEKVIGSGVLVAIAIIRLLMEIRRFKKQTKEDGN